MSTLVVVGYDDPYKAEQVRLKLRKLAERIPVGFEDLAFARGRIETPGRLECGKNLESSWRRDNEHSDASASALV
jgi:uncharacterized membrane protein